MARPGLLCKLKKDESIYTQDGFVDTFNWMVDYINNLKGDKDNIEVSNPTGSNPEIKFVGDGGGSFDVKCIDSDGHETTFTVDGTVTLQAGEDTNASFVAEDGVIKLDVRYK